MTTLTDTVVPTWIAVALGVATIAMLLGTVLLMLRSKKAADAQANPNVKHEKMLRRLFLAALIPTLLVIAAVMGISFIGLSSFARHDMGWTSWVSLIVPISLDGISITFGFWAFVAVLRGRHPGRSEKIVYVGALVSAWITYNHGRQEWTGAAGIYLGFLSIAAAWMFHELLRQFMDSHDNLPKARRNGIPIFGERWMWAPLSTFKARRAWVVYPPSPDVEPTTANALTHLEHINARKKKTSTRKPASTRTPSTTRNTTSSKPATKPAAKPASKATSRKPSTRKPVPAPDVAPSVVDSNVTESTPKAPVAPATPTPVIKTSVPALKAAASAKDTSVATADAARPITRPVPASLLTRARHLAQAHHASQGNVITANELAVRMRVNSDVATQLLALLDLDPNRPDQPATPVNGTPVGVLR